MEKMLHLGAVGATTSPPEPKNKHALEGCVLFSGPDQISGAEALHAGAEAPHAGALTHRSERTPPHLRPSASPSEGGRRSDTKPSATKTPALMCSLFRLGAAGFIGSAETRFRLQTFHFAPSGLNGPFKALGLRLVPEPHTLL